VSILNLIKKTIKNIIFNIYDINIDEDILKIEKPPENQPGQFGVNAPFIISKLLHKNPFEIAETIALKMKENNFFSNVVVIKPGYINWDLSADFYKKELTKIINEPDYFKSKEQKRQKINLEFVSANPVGPLNVVSGRAAAYGDVLANLFKYNGYDVSKEFYINDHGNQLKLFAISLKERYLELHNIKSKAEIPQDGYKGDYVIELARKIDEKIKDAKEKVLNLYKTGNEQQLFLFFKETGLKLVLDWQQNTLKNFMVNFDIWFSEETLYLDNYLEKVIKKIEEKGLLYEKEGAVWFKTTDFGDDKDRVIKKSDGEWTYFASDIAYMQSKIDRGADKIVMILGPDHHGYIKRIEAIIRALGYEIERLKVIILQQVNLLEAGEKKKMSKREGKLVLLDELLESVGADAARYYFLMRNYNSHLDFDIELAKEQSEKNPVYYVQYAYARICNILLFAKEKNINIEKLNGNDISFSNLEKEEMELISMILQTPDVIVSSLEKYSPSYIIQILYNLASIFHAFYNKYRVVTDDKENTYKRLFIIQTLKITFLNYFNILGITAKERM
jgi:arginyl-tRNA synthetase